jgi:hypothetical protein
MGDVPVSGVITKEEAFRNGASAMQSRIVAWLMAKNLFTAAQEAIGLRLPDYREPETITLNTKDK